MLYLVHTHDDNFVVQVNDCFVKKHIFLTAESNNQEHVGQLSQAFLFMIVLLRETFVKVVFVLMSLQGYAFRHQLTTLPVFWFGYSDIE